jgi:methylmalonyl-CoA mutase cobalamin-binding subunit
LPRQSPQSFIIGRYEESFQGHLGRRLKMLAGKPCLDGHSKGAEQIAVAARDSGIEVVYEGIRLTPARIDNAAFHAVTPAGRA